MRKADDSKAKLEYMGHQRVGTRDAPDCLHRAAKARNAIAGLRALASTGAKR